MSRIVSRACVVGVALVAALTPHRSAAQVADRAAAIALMDSIAESPIIEGRAVGIAVAVVQNGETLLYKGYGSADIERSVPTPHDAIFEIGSITKQFTAAAILQLRDAGKVDLDADITRYLPDYPTQGRKIPVRRLLDHTSGIRGITEIPAFRELMRQRDWPRDSAIALFARQPFDFEPGEAQIYNNSAYILLGHIIEKVSGMSYEDYVEQKIFAPLGMTRSSYCNYSDTVSGRAAGYRYENRQPAREPGNVHTWPYSAGSLCSTAGDLATWLQALHGGKVLAPKSYAEMIAPGKLNDGTALRYGMGLGLVPDPRGARMISHGGGIEGFVSHSAWYPDHGLAVVVLMNSTGNVSPAALGSEIAAEIIPPVRATLQSFGGDVAGLTGTYAGAGRGREFRVVITEDAQGRITASANGSPARALSWVGGLKFQLGGADLVFERPDPAAPAAVLRFDTGGGHFILKRN